MKSYSGVLLALTVFCLLLAAAPQTAALAQDQEAASADGLHANLENLQLIDFIKFVASYTGRNIVFQEAKIPKTTVTIFSSQSMNEPELMAVFEQVLNSAKLYAVARGNVLYILNQTEATELDAGINPPVTVEDELITTVFRLRGDVSPNLASSLMTKFSSKYGQVQPIPQANSIMIRDRRDRIDQMSELLDTVQTLKPSWRTEVLELKFAKASDAATKLSAFYKTLTDQGQMSEAPLITPVEWRNSLMVSGTKQQIETVKGLLVKIDGVSEIADEYKLRIYHLQNAKADTAASVLQSLAQTESNKEGAAAGGGRVSFGNSEFMVSADTETNSIVALAKSDFIEKMDDIMRNSTVPWTRSSSRP